MRYLPYFWIILTPIVTIPATMAMMTRLTEHCVRLDTSNQFRGYFSCPTGEALLTLSPAILNLLPLLLLLHPAAVVKVSAAIAGALGILRTAIPAIGVAVNGAIVEISCGDASCIFEHDYSLGVMIAGFVLWDISAIAYFVELFRGGVASFRRGVGRRYLVFWWLLAIPFALYLLLQAIYFGAICLQGNCR